MLDYKRALLTCFTPYSYKTTGHMQRFPAKQAPPWWQRGLQSSADTDCVKSAPNLEKASLCLQSTSTRKPSAVSSLQETWF